MFDAAPVGPMGDVTLIDISHSGMDVCRSMKAATRFRHPSSSRRADGSLASAARFLCARLHFVFARVSSSWRRHQYQDGRFIIRSAISCGRGELKHAAAVANARPSSLNIQGSSSRSENRISISTHPSRFLFFFVLLGPLRHSLLWA